MSLAERLRFETRAHHTRAEHSGIMQDLLRGELGRAPYALLLRNLYAIYAALEPALLRHKNRPALAPIHDPALFRCAALAADLETLHGSGWAEALPVSESAREYADRVRRHADTDPELLLAHAYVRYLGDLSGGQILQGIVQRAMQLPDDGGTRFYRFGPSDARGLATRFRSGLDAIPLGSAAAADRLVGEAQWAFSMHARLFEELALALRPL
ncbi:MAG: biliverdin-producing heme oxygenase [Panacagrimonas sp.]